MKRMIQILFILFSVSSYAMTMKTPMEFPNTVEIVDKQYSVIYRVKTQRLFESYTLNKIEFTDAVFERNKIILLEIKPYREQDFFCFEINKKDLPQDDYISAWIYLYNNETKRYECYKK